MTPASTEGFAEQMQQIRSGAMQMTNKLSPVVELTDRQAKFVQAIASGMTGTDAYYAITGSDCNYQTAASEASKLRRSPKVAQALKEVLRNQRLTDLDSAGRLIADTLQDQENARQRGADAAVAAFARMRGNWLGIERQTLVLRPESLLSDAELVERLAGEDPDRVAAARTLLGVADGFPEPQDAEFEEVGDIVVTSESAGE